MANLRLHALGSGPYSLCVLPPCNAKPQLHVLEQSLPPLDNGSCLHSLPAFCAPLQQQR